MKVGLIGCGRMGQRHISALKQLDIHDIYVADMHKANLEVTQKLYNLQDTCLYSDTETMLRDQRPECVIIATTAPVHSDLTVLAAHAGATYILCEKPMATSIADCQKMIDTCQKTGTHLAINHQMRFMEQYTRVKSMIDAGLIGDLRTITVKAGNFGLSMNGTHYIEMFRFMTDDTPKEVTAWLSHDLPSPRGPHFMDKAGCLRVLSEKGYRLELDADEKHGHGVWVTYTGRCGQIFVDELSGILYANYRMEAQREQPTTRYGEKSHVMWEMIKPADIVDATRDVLKALLEGKNYPRGDEAMLSIQTLVAAYVSHEKGHRSIMIDDPLVINERTFPWA